MKKLLCSFTAVSVSAMSLFSSMPALTLAADSYEPEPQMISVVYGEPSESGFIDQYYVDRDGNKVTFDLTPDYMKRAADLPEKFDLRSYNGNNYVTPVKSQGSTGTCWAHAAVAAAESNMIMQGLADADTVDYSEAHLAWFGMCKYSTDASDPLYHDGFNNGTDGYLIGGNDSIAEAVLSRGSGVVSQSVTGSVTNLPELDESLRYLSEAYLIKSDEIDITDFDAVKQHLMTVGALTTGYYDDSNDADENYSQNYYSYYCPDEDAVSNHAVTIVGWDDNFSNGKFSNGTPKNNGAWICKNSWGTNYGDSGYFYISYYDESLDSAVSYEMGDRSDYPDIYQYDGIGGSAITYGGSYGIAGANIFTASKSESITSVAFQTHEASIPYTIKVYKNVTSGKPTSGTLALTQTGTMTYAGYHIIDLEKSVKVTEGSNFSIVVSLESAGAYLPTDNNSNASGQSYLASYSSGKIGSWSDLHNYSTSNGSFSTNCNVMIKAFAKSGVEIDEENFPDDNFRSYISTNIDSGQKDGILSDSEISAVKSMDISALDIADLTGIGHFTALTSLDISSNPIYMADLSSNTNLTKLTADNIGLETAGSASCNYLNTLGLDTSKMSDISGAELINGVLYPTDNQITYTYNCGNSLTIRPLISVDSFAHSFSTWTDNGNGSHSRICSECGISETESHTFGDWTANINGTHSHKCSICGAVETDEHTVGEWISDKNGSHHTVCTICGETITESCNFGEWSDNGDGSHSRTCADCGYVETAEHDFGEWSDNGDGTHSRTCADCGYVETAEHDFGELSDNGDGSHSRTCSDCGYIETAEHDFGEWSDNGDGSHSRTCSDCGYVETAEHDFGKWSDNGDGSHSRTCADCGYVETAEHDFGELSDNGGGTHSRSCADCGYVETAEHDFGEWSDNGDGSHSRTCADCGYVETAEHDFGEWSDNGDGTHSRTCADCDYVETAEHDLGKWSDNGNGTHSRTCADCGYVETAEHDFGKWSDNGDGSHSRSCADCGYVETAEHDFGEWSDNGDGTHSRTCADCGYVETAEHDFGGWTINMNGTRTRVCSICGHIEIEVIEGIIKGDLTGDGKVTVFDLIMMRKHLVNNSISGTITALTADFNGDEEFSIADLVAINNFILGE